MPGPPVNKKLPDTAELQRRISLGGWSQTRLARHYGASPGGISKALKARAEEEARCWKGCYLIPWDLAPEHEDHELTHKLLALNALLKDPHVTDEQVAVGAELRARLERAGAVVTYDRKNGYAYDERQWVERDQYVRRPERAEDRTG